MILCSLLSIRNRVLLNAPALDGEIKPRTAPPPPPQPRDNEISRNCGMVVSLVVVPCGHQVTAI